MAVARYWRKHYWFIWSKYSTTKNATEITINATKDNITRSTCSGFPNLSQYTYNSFVTFQRHVKSIRWWAIGSTYWKKLVMTSLLVISLTIHILPISQIFCCTNEINFPLTKTSQAAVIVSGRKSCAWLQDYP